MKQLRSVTCHIGSHSVTCYPTQANTPHLNPSQVGTRFAYPRGMEGWVDLVDLIAPWPGVEPAIFRSRVRRRTTAPPRQLYAPYGTQCCSFVFLPLAAGLMLTKLDSGNCILVSMPSFQQNTYPLDGFCLQWCGSVTYGTTAPVRYYPSTALVLLWSSVPCQHRSRPLPSSPGLLSGSSERLAGKNWKTEANLAENGWGWFAPAQLWPGDGKTVRYG